MSYRLFSKILPTGLLTAICLSGGQASAVLVEDLKSGSVILFTQVRDSVVRSCDDFTGMARIGCKSGYGAFVPRALVLPNQTAVVTEIRHYQDGAGTFVRSMGYTIRFKLRECESLCSRSVHVAKTRYISDAFDHGFRRELELTGVEKIR